MHHIHVTIFVYIIFFIFIENVNGNLLFGKWLYVILVYLQWQSHCSNIRFGTYTHIPPNLPQHVQL